MPNSKPNKHTPTRRNRNRKREIFASAATFDSVGRHIADPAKSRKGIMKRAGFDAAHEDPNADENLHREDVDHGAPAPTPPDDADRSRSDKHGEDIVDGERDRHG